MCNGLFLREKTEKPDQHLKSMESLEGYEN